MMADPSPAYALIAFSLDHRQRGCGGPFEGRSTPDGRAFDLRCVACAHTPGDAVRIDAEHLQVDELFGYVRLALRLYEDVTFSDHEWRALAGVEGLVFLCEMLGVTVPRQYATRSQAPQ